MNHSGDAAEQIMRISLDGAEHAIRIAGSGAKNIAALIMAAVRSDNSDVQLKLSGKERLSNMLKSGKELKIFSMKNSDLEQFSKEAKRYGVVYCALKEKGGSSDSLVDVMAKAEDAGKISRIMERLQFATVDRVSVESKLAEQVHNAPEQNDVDTLLDQLIDSNGKAVKEENCPLSTIDCQLPINPISARTENQSHQSVSRSDVQSKSAEKSTIIEAKQEPKAELRFAGGLTNTKQKPDSVKEFLQERTAQNLKKRDEKKPEQNQSEAKGKQPERKPNKQQQSRNKSNKSKKKSKKGKNNKER